MFNDKFKEGVCKTIFVCIFLSTVCVRSQQILTIDKVNEIVMSKSNRIKMVYNVFLRNSIENSLYEISLLPKVTSSVTFPYQRSISEVLQSDGSQRFIERNYINSSFNLNVSQPLPFTGGKISVNSSINGSRDFNNNITSFSSNWVNISYQQSLNGYNSFKWTRKINDLNIRKDSIDFLKEKIKLKNEVSEKYLDVYLIQMKIQLLEENINKSEKNVIELEEKFKFGRTIKIEVDQAKVGLEQLKSQLEVHNMEFRSGINELKKYMDYDDQPDFLLQAVVQENYIIDRRELKSAIRNNGFDLEKAIRLLESESNIDQVKKEGAISMNIQFGMGLNSSASQFADLYNTPSQSQFVTIGAKIPIIDWGEAKRKISLAKLEKDYIEYTFKEEEKRIDNQLEEFLNYKESLVAQKKSLAEQLALSKKIMEMFDEMLKLGRKTVTDYKIQLVEYFNINLEYQKTVNNLYLLKLKINEMKLIL